MVKIRLIDGARFEKGLLEFAEEYQFCLCQDADAVEVRAIRSSDGLLTVTGNLDEKILISYPEKIHFFRGFSLFLEKLADGERVFNLREKPQFTTNGVMVDTSQGNAVPTVRTVKSFLRRMALMGLNMLMLYCEDGFLVQEEPYFGYMRGRYTEEELKECDDYADLFGIEMIPCIQTLAHLPEPLRWKGVYGDITENAATLLPGEKRTYEFIRHLIETASRPFRSKRIHIGMDEAWRLGRGKYFDKHGYVPTGEIMISHLKKVMKIVRSLGLSPMMWSDMFFRAYAPDGDYYNPKTEIPTEAVEQVPSGIKLVYWDYYHYAKDTYKSFIDKHRKLGEPIFAGGIWSWLGFGVNWAKTSSVTGAALTACKERGVKEVFVTIWGDNGAEVNLKASLLGLCLFAEHGYTENLSQHSLRSRFSFCTGGRYGDFYNLQYLDEVPGCKPGNPEDKNPSKYLMWQDILTGLFDVNIKGLPLKEHYASLTEKFQRAAERNGDFNDLFAFSAQVSKVLSIKSEIGIQIRKAYLDGDRQKLTLYADQILPNLYDEVKTLRQMHKALWFDTYKPLGWDVQDIRYGALLIRIRSAIEELSDYLNGTMEKILELEEPRLPYDGQEGLVSYANWYGQIVSPSPIAPET